MKNDTYAARTFQVIGKCRRLENLHPEANLALALDLPEALGDELTSLESNIRTRVADGTLDEGAIRLIGRLTDDLANLARAQTSLSDVRRRRVDLAKRASAAKRETIDKLMTEALERAART